jgi:hypothetical protein
MKWGLVKKFANHYFGWTKALPLRTTHFMTPGRRMGPPLTEILHFFEGEKLLRGGGKAYKIDRRPSRCNDPVKSRDLSTRLQPPVGFISVN